MWKCALELNKNREIVAGSRAELAGAIARGADLRLYTHFDWLDHMRSEPDQGLIEESIDLRVTYRLGGEWIAALTALRYPAEAGLGFGANPSLSFFMYNPDGQFGIARPHFAGVPEGIRAPQDSFSNATYHVLDHHDDQATSPSHNAIYKFNLYRFLVRDAWEEVLSHDEDGNVVGGSLEALETAFRAGRSLKVGVAGLCDYLAPENPLDHEVFIELGSLYYHIEQGFFSGESLPLVRIAPHIPLKYETGNWDFGWILPRTDGRLFHLSIEPQTREIRRHEARHAIRWFAL